MKKKEKKPHLLKIYRSKTTTEVFSLNESNEYLTAEESIRRYVRDSINAAIGRLCCKNATPTCVRRGKRNFHENPCESVYFRHESEICHEIEDHVALWALPIDARERCYAKARYVRPATRTFEYRYQMTFTKANSM